GGSVTGPPFLPPHVHRSDEILRGIDLNPVHAVELGLAHRRAREPRRIDVLVLGEALVIAQRLSIGIDGGRALVDRLADDLHARAREHAGVDRVAYLDRVEAAARVHVEYGGESG